MRLAIFSAAVLLAAPCFAATISVTFDTVAVDGELQVLPGGVFSGIRFVETPTVGALHLVDDGGCFVGCAASGSTSPLYEGIHNAGQPPLTIEHPAGLSFRLLSFDAGEVSRTFGPPEDINAVGIGLVGTLAAGGTVEVFIDLDGVVDGPGGVDDFQNFTLDAAFADAILSSVAVWGLYEVGFLPLPPDEFTDVSARAGFQLDNVLFDVQGDHVDYTQLGVPEPSSAVLAWFAIASSLAIRGLLARPSRLDPSRRRGSSRCR